jgi:hypothetical protein
MEVGQATLNEEDTDLRIFFQDCFQVRTLTHSQQLNLTLVAICPIVQPPRVFLVGSHMYVIHCHVQVTSCTTKAITADLATLFYSL